MIKTYKFELRPTKAQITAFSNQLAVHSTLYNVALATKQAQFTATGKSDSCFTQIKALIPSVRQSDAGKLCNYSSLQQTVRRLHKNYAAIYSGRGGKPRHKPLSSITYSKESDGWKLKGESLYLQNVGEVEIIKHREVIGDLLSLTVKLENNKFCACISVESGVEAIKATGNGVIGLDYGMKSFITTSNGDKVTHPEPLKRKLKALKKVNRQIKASSGQRKSKKAKARRKIYEKVRNQRRDFAHKLSRKLVNENNYIAVEDLNHAGLVSSISNINRKGADLAVAQFYQFLSYKAESAGRQFVKVNPAYTSQTCYCCGNKKVIPLTQREYDCECGNKMDRDTNAAKNILSAALKRVPVLAVGLHSIASNHA